MTAISIIIGNEQTKLLASALDRLSTACFVAGFIAPTAAAGPSVTASFSTIVWILAGCALHSAARLVLKGLRA
jgi:hypothetical protein